MIADKYGLTREDMDQYSLASHRKATAATAAGAFEREILPIAITDAQGDPAWHVADEGIRRDATNEAISSVRTLAEGGAITAANASQIADGSAAVLIVSEEALKINNLTHKERIAHFSVNAGDPVMMLEEPIPATERVLKRTGLKIGDRIGRASCRERACQYV